MDELANDARRTLRGTLAGRLAITAIAVASLIAASAFAFVALRVHQHQQQAASLLRPSGIPANVPTSMADLMELSPVPASAAPDFTLTDQAGHTMTMASLRGHVVVLEFMDPHCTDICPIVSQEFIDAYRDLGGKASQVVFAAVNVNRYHLQVADVAAFSHEQHLSTVPSWHFFTGSYASLQAVWHDYAVEVEAPSRNADVIHSSFVYFIDPQGHERFLANPMVDHTAGGTSYLPAGQLATWARGIALVARQLAS
jgi:cytochrome oxidase Cu insertion factor (SCO1/SenC/PrrC family)